MKIGDFFMKIAKFSPREINAFYSLLFLHPMTSITKYGCTCTFCNESTLLWQEPISVKIRSLFFLKFSWAVMVPWTDHLACHITEQYHWQEHRENIVWTIIDLLIWRRHTQQNIYCTRNKSEYLMSLMLAILCCFHQLIF